jgi:hypothetical protein
VRGGRPVGGYRFSNRFISVVTALILLVMGVTVVGGFVLGTFSDSIEGMEPEDVVDLSGVIIVAGFLVPLLIAAILGGEAIRRGGGLVGFGLILGVGLFTALPTLDMFEFLGAWRIPLIWIGAGLIVVSGVGFWLLGRAAGVPMWLQAPVVGSPRVYVQGRSEKQGDVNLGGRRPRKQ